MTPTELMLFTTGILDDMQLPYAVTGSMASTFYGEMRTTNDVDIVVDLPASRIREFAVRFPQDDFYVSEDAVRAAILHRSQFNILHATSG